MSAPIRMKRSSMRGLLGTAALLATASLGACDDATNPIEDFGQLGDPYVRFEFPDEIGVPGFTVPAIFLMTTPIEENVDITFTFGGTATYGTDYWAVDREGVRRTDVTESGGTARLTFDPARTNFPRDTLLIFVPAGARDGRTATIEIASASGASGRTIQTGYIEEYRSFDLNIEGFVDIQTGAYAGEMAGDIGEGPIQVTVSKPATPVTIDGIPYAFVLSDITGAGALFGQPVPWAFNVTSGGSVLASPHSPVSASATADVLGEYDFGTRTLSLLTELTCCGGEGLTWEMVVSQP